jgi:hypothetical protein
MESAIGTIWMGGVMPSLKSSDEPNVPNLFTYEHFYDKADLL